MAWNIKRFSNDELRQRFVGMIAGAGQGPGPDPAGHGASASTRKPSKWEHGALDWDEFHEVLAGRGPCNAQRLERRREAHENGAWVREAAAAYAAKQAQKAQVA